MLLLDSQSQEGFEKVCLQYEAIECLCGEIEGPSCMCSGVFRCFKNEVLGYGWQCHEAPREV